MEGWVWVSTTGVAPVTTIYKYSRRGGTYTIVTYVYHDGRKWCNFAPGVVLITPRGKRIEGEEAVRREIVKRNLPPFFD